MWFTFAMYDPENGRKVSLEGQAETVPEVLELFLPFLNGSDFPYIEQLMARYNGGKVVSSEL
jgi:hypothetical protein